MVRRTLFLLALLASGTPPAQAQTTGGDVQARFIHALTLLNTGDTAGAEAALADLLDRYPESPAVLVALARSRDASGDPEGALVYARQALALAQGSRPLTGLVARLLVAADRPAQAAETYGAYLRAAPEDAAAYLAQARLWLDAGRPDDAAASLRALLALPTGRYVLLQHAVSDPGSALLPLAAELRPTDGALSAWATSDPASPTDRAPTAASEDPPARLDPAAASGTPAEQEAYGHALLAAGRAAEAAAVLTALTQSTPQALGAWALAAEALRLSGDAAGALALAEDAGFLFPGQTDLLAEQALALASLGRPAEAAARLERAEALLQTDGLDRGALVVAVWLARAALPDSSPEALDRARAAADGDPLALELLGAFLAAHGDSGGARTAWTQALDAAPPAPLAARLQTRLDGLGG